MSSINDTDIKGPEPVLHDADKHAHFTGSDDFPKVGSGQIDFLDSKAERALVWKFDLRILPVLAVMYLFNSLDKSNLGKNYVSR